MDQPVHPAVLADAISKLDTLRLSRTPSTSASALTSSSNSPTSGSTSPVVPPTMPSHEAIVNAVAHHALEGKPISVPASVPGTPHFGAQSEM